MALEVTTFLLYTIIFVVSAIIYYIKRRLNYWKIRGIPHDEPTLLEGNFEGFLKTRNFATITKATYLKYRGSGPFCGFYFFQRPATLLLDLNLIKRVLITDFNNFTDRGFYCNEKDDPLTGHLFLMPGQKWRTLRNKLSPTFTSGKMKFMFPTVVQVAEQFVEVFDDLLKTNNIIEMKDLFARFTTDIIGTCAFGIECNSLKDPNVEFRTFGDLCMEPHHNPFITGLMQGFPNIARKLGMRFIRRDVSDFFLRVVRETVDYRIKNNVKRNDFLSLLIDLSNNKKDLGEEYDDLRGLTVEEMAAQVFIFFVGGFDTSSNTLGFLMYELARHQDVQTKLREEVQQVLKKHDGKFSYECMMELPYMNAVIAEIQRIYPVAPFLTREAKNDYQVAGHPQYTIAKGMTVFIPVLGIHHDPVIYPNPEVFDPERFTAEKVLERDSVTWLPFGEGPRNCIGMRFGQMQMRVGLTYLLKNFKFSVCEKTKIPINFDQTAVLLYAKDGIYLKVERV